MICCKRDALKKFPRFGILFVILLAFVFSGCSGRFAQPTPIPARRPTDTLPPTRTPWPTNTPWILPTRIPTKTSTPKPPPLPPLSGRLLLQTGLIELRWLDFDGDRASLGEPFVSDLRQYAVSPDGRYLLYSGLETPVTLLDLLSGEQRQLAAEPSGCFAWSPEGSRFSYTRPKSPAALFAYELENSRSTEISDVACGNYLDFNAEGRLCGELTCGAWLDETRLLFRRFTGSLPAKVTDLGGLTGQLKPYPYPELRADHSTIATIENGRVGLEELPELWNELERCPDQPYLLLRNDWATESDVFIAPVFSDFSLFQPTPLPAIVGADLRQEGPLFVDADCRVAYSLRKFHSDAPVLILLDPATLQEVYRSVRLPQDWVWSGVWADQPGDQFAVIERPRQDGTSIGLIDLDNGAFANLFDLNEVNMNVIAWVGR